MSRPHAVEIYIDGASSGNPGPAGVGIVLIEDAAKPGLGVSKYLGETTNNVAEYLALVYALQEAMQRGYRAVSVSKALCFVPRTGDLRSEYRRKVRTIARGLHTLGYKRSLLNPWRYGLFAWMLFSHKVCRWLVPWAALAGLVPVSLGETKTPVLVSTPLSSVSSSRSMPRRVPEPGGTAV